MSEDLVVVDLDLTVYSLGEFLRVHPRAPGTWVNALCRLAPDACDRAIDAVWASVQPHIAQRIEAFEALARQHGREILWLTAFPLTPTKLASFADGQRTASSFPHSKVRWAKGNALTTATAVVGDRRTDALLAGHLGAAFAGYRVWHRAQRLLDGAYTDAFVALWAETLGPASWLPARSPDAAHPASPRR